MLLDFTYLSPQSKYREYRGKRESNVDIAATPLTIGDPGTLTQSGGSRQTITVALYLRTPSARQAQGAGERSYGLSRA